MSGESLSIPGVLYVGMSGEHEQAALQVGPAVGWIALKGLHTWSHEISVVLKSDLTSAIRSELRVMLPEVQAREAKLENAARAAAASTLVGVESSMGEELQGKGVRVHTVGSDRITGGVFYFAKGGAGGAVRVQGNLIEMLAPAMAASADNATLEAALDGLIGRMLGELSGGVLSEAAIELAAALPSLGEPAADAMAKLQTLEGYLMLAGTRAAKYEERARAVVDALGQAARQGKERVEVALFSEARRVVQAPVEIEYAEGESGTQTKRTLPERTRWFVPGLIKETIPPPAVTPKVDEAKIAAEKAALQRAAAAEKAATEKAAAEKAAAEKAAAEKAAAEKAAAEKAAAEKAAAEKAAAEKAAAEKAAAEKAAAEKAAAEKAAAEKAAAEKAAAEKAAAEKAAAEKAAAAEKKAAGEKKATPEKKEAPGKKAEKKAAAKKAEEKKPVQISKPPAAPVEEPGRTPGWVWLVLLLIAVAGSYYFAFVRHHH